MGSLGNIGEEGEKGMWLYPKVIGSNPSERWGHSSCFFQGHLYVFGGCCGGMHFSDVLVLNLETMSWSTMVTLGSGPGPRDSHSATLWGNKIIVFGGTNGSKKVNDLHILDLESKEWIQPICIGTPPSARESHTATLFGGEKLVVFGGSGEGVGNYLNDLHILDLKTMSWSSPVVKGEVPPRDSHTTTAVGSKLFVYGGDFGDRYHGGVDVLDLETLMWSRFVVQGSPGRRAGHASVGIGAKMYVIGGVGDKIYYNDVWVLHTPTLSWSKLEICGQPPQGRFSHTAIVTDSDIAIYGGCGEDERPLGELLLLQLRTEHQKGCYNISTCGSFGSHWNQGRRRGLPRVENGLKTMLLGSCIEAEKKEAHELENSISKRLRRTVNANTWDRESEQDEHSLSVSQNSSPSQSDQEQSTTKSPTISQGLSCPSLNYLNKSQGDSQSNKSRSQQILPDVYILGEHRANMRRRPFLSSSNTVRGEADFLTSESRHMNQIRNQNLLGADVQGKVDGAFDSGYLMTANVNGRIFRGVLFAPGPDTICREANSNQYISGRVTAPQPCTNTDRGSVYWKNSLLQPINGPSQGSTPGPFHQKMGSPSPSFRAVPSRERELMRDRGDLKGVMLTLGGPGSS